MFGLALRSYRRRIQRLSESQTDRTRSLWEAVLEYLSQGRLVTRQEVFKRFFRDEESLVRGVLRDLTDSGLVLLTGSGKSAAYRAATRDELTQVHDRGEGVTELLWTFVYREGPITPSELARVAGTEVQQTQTCLDQLEASGQVQRSTDGHYTARSVLLPVDAAAGWEAAMFDHYQAVVQTLCQRLRASAEEDASSLAGGSTYRLNVWPGHPLEEAVKGALSNFREQTTALREKVQDYNREHGLPARYEQVCIYGGQSITAQELETK